MAELRYDLPIGNWGARSWMLSAAQIYGLADFGYVLKSGDLLIGEKRSEAGASLGIGMRVKAFDYMSGLVEVAQPIGHGVEFENDSRDPRVFFGVSLDY